MTDEQINILVSTWVKKKANRRLIVEEYANTNIFEESEHPSTIMMAGCTGAGKTEFSKSLLALTERLPGMKKYVRTDADELYVRLKQEFSLDGDYRDILNFPCIKLVEAMCDHALEKEQNLLIDSSFSQSKALDNVARSLKHNRVVRIYFIYEQPKVAWNYVLKRERIEGRSVSEEFFIQTYLGSIATVSEAISRFGDKIIVDIYRKSTNVHSDILIPKFEQLCRVLSVADLDKIIVKKYNEDELSEEIATV